MKTKVRDSAKFLVYFYGFFKVLNKHKNKNYKEKGGEIKVTGKEGMEVNLLFISTYN